MFLCVGPDCDRMDVTIRKWLDRCSQLTITTSRRFPEGELPRRGKRGHPGVRSLRSLGMTDGETVRKT